MNLSQRAQKLLGSPSAIMQGYETCAQDPYSLENPAGYLNFGIAENHLCDDVLLPQINSPIFLEPEHIQYCSLNGLEPTREIIAEFLKQYLNIRPVNPANIIVNNGVSALCESLSFALFDAHDKILIPTPYYTGFEHDFTKRFQCQFVPVHLNPKNELRHEITPFKEVLKLNADAKAVLICHPHNPTGEILSQQFMQDLCDFCLENNLTLISDEIYALSTHQHKPHQSLFQLARDKGVKAHLLYGMAKDFCLAGFKLGFFYTEDSDVLQAMQANSYFYTVSSPTQLILNNLLGDTPFLEKYLPENQRRLAEVRQLIETQLPQLKFIPGDSGVFMLLDLSQYCETFEAEERLFEQFLTEHRIFLTPGGSMGMQFPGYFRVCYTRKPEVVAEFIERMQRVNFRL